MAFDLNERGVAQDVVDRWAQDLDEAEQQALQIGQFAKHFPNARLADSYAIQSAWVARKVAAGQRIVGHKIGLTSRAMQEAFGIDEPDFGVLLDRMVHQSGATLSFDALIEPRLEAEIAFIFGKRLACDTCSATDVLAATRFVMPALEIIDARIARQDPATGKRRGVLDTIADNAANAAIVVGGRMIAPEALDLAWVPVQLHRNSAIEESGVSGAVMSHPANAVAWLVRTLTRVGTPPEAGQIILSGSFIRPVDIRRGDVFHADFGPMGSIGCRFA